MAAKKPIDPIKQILKENERRQKANNAPFNPITGLGSVLQTIWKIRKGHYKTNQTRYTER